MRDAVDDLYRHIAELTEGGCDQLGVGAGLTRMRISKGARQRLLKAAAATTLLSLSQTTGP